MGFKPTYLSLFSGIGGLDYGLEAAGFDNVGCIEWDKEACSNLILNNQWEVFQGDIRSIPADRLRRKLGFRKGQLDLIVGGPPCQSYSKSSFWAEGIKRGYKDKRGKLIDEYLSYVEEFLPKVFLIENVPGFVYEGQSGGMKSLKRFLNRLKKDKRTSYEISFQVINCADWGIPQRRERVFIVGNRLGVEFEFPEKKYSDPSDTRVTGLLPYKTASDAFSGLDDSHIEEDLSVGGKWAELLPCVPPGENYQFFTTNGDGPDLFEYRSRYWTFLLKLHPKKPSWTIQASPGSSTGPFHWNNRKLSGRELARIQTIPDRIRLSGSRQTIQKLIGNAVPSLVGEILGKNIKNQIFDIRVKRTYKLLPGQSQKIYRPRIKTHIPREYRI